MTKYKYVESGLTNVYINGITPVVDDDGDEVVTIPHVAQLHVEIARGIITRDGTMGGDEIRFLRTEMGMTQTQLAEKVNVTGLTLGRWERSEHSIDPTAETVIRRLAGERLIEAFDQSIEDLVKHVQATSDADSINIQANEHGYTLLAA